jgi:hypothetical protein
VRAHGGVFLFYGFFLDLDLVFLPFLCSTVTETVGLGWILVDYVSAIVIYPTS